jgi:tRNA(Arg) A34 adenosine deaminase TadA
MSESDTLMTRTFELAAVARESGDHPFGALLAVDGTIVAEAVNRVNTAPDITAHAETELVRILEREGRLHLLPDGVVYASCEPCPMCVAAMFWAGARRVVFGLSAARLAQLATPPDGSPVGFTITAAEIGRAARPPMEIDGPHREDEAAETHVGFWY